MNITAVVLHYRNWPDVAEVIRHLQAQTEPLEIVLVDNASGDGSIERIRAQFPELDILESPVNGGYAAGMNLGRRHTHSDAILLLTHDVLLEPTAVEQLATRLKGRTGAVGPLLMRADRSDEVWSAGGYIGEDMIPGHHTDHPSGPRTVEWIDGACMLVSAQAFDEVGPIDEGYFLYFEEVDFACRLREKAWTIECEPSAVARQTPGQLPQVLYRRNWLRFVSRNMGPGAAFRAGLWTMKRAVGALLPRDLKRAVRLVAGLLAYALRLPPKWLVR